MPDSIIADYETGVIVAVEKRWLLIGDSGSTFLIVYFENFNFMSAKKLSRQKPKKNCEKNFLAKRSCLKMKVKPLLADQICSRYPEIRQIFAYM